MSLPSSLLRTSFRCPSSLPHARFSLKCLNTRVRKLATQRDNVNLDTQRSPLSQSLDTGRSRSSARPESIGPFQLGISQQALRSGEKAKKWSELSTGGKVVRTASQTKNLAVILIGAGLASLLIYTITSEMYSSNSPTNLFKDACERIKRNPRARHNVPVFKYLNGPLTFHNNPPSLVRPRHRNRHVTSQIFVDAHGHEHMIMTFYIQGRLEGSTPLPSEIGYYEAFSHWIQEKAVHIPELSLDEAIGWTKDRAESMWERSKQTFKYLSGAPVSAPPLPSPTEQDKQTGKREQEKSWSFAGMFSSLKGPQVGSEPFTSSRVDNRTFTEGEVHADLVRNSDGYFVFRYLLVDIPNTRDSNPVRVFVERGPGVRDNEPVMRWNAH
ncbi:hypothetical protein D9756_004200 [Leucocoprinus leucothites]|uniref:Mitochondrial import inner membrane translocase subunit Tim21 n=1 Tax=Leucocoprinus leucothites TaxID=201217 RepID=A0A8H5G0M5_9AGAR|nr:hypothetical protein D9756_004200 [Leucoagaricus leucothites]